MKNVLAMLAVCLAINFATAATITGPTKIALEEGLIGTISVTTDAKGVFFQCLDKGLNYLPINSTSGHIWAPKQGIYRVQVIATNGDQLVGTLQIEVDVGPIVPPKSYGMRLDPPKTETVATVPEPAPAIVQPTIYYQSAPTYYRWGLLGGSCAGGVCR